MKIALLRHEDQATYSELVQSHGSVFNSLEWLTIYNDAIKIYGIYEDSDRLIGGFHLFDQSRYGIRIGFNPPFCPIIGPFYKITAEKPVYRNDFIKKLTSLLADFLSGQPWGITHLAFSPVLQDMQPFLWRKYKISLHYTYLVDLENRNEEQIFKGMSDDRRNDIRKAQRDGFYTEPITNPDVMYQLVCNTYSRQNKSIPTELLHKILYHFARPENSFGYMTVKESIPYAAAFCIYDSHTAYYLLGGHHRENRHHGAGPLAVWECIKKAQDLGLSTFDFEGSMIQPIERYFRGFGGKLVSYYTINKAWLPLEMILKLIKREWF